MIKFFHVAIMFFIVGGLFGAGFFLFSHQRDIAITPGIIVAAVSGAVGVNVSDIPEATSSIATSTLSLPISGSDLPPQPHLTNPPTIIKGIYITGWTAGSE